jgi:hypothetical protein
VRGVTEAAQVPAKLRGPNFPGPKLLQQHDGSSAEGLAVSGSS